MNQLLCLQLMLICVNLNLPSLYCFVSSILINSLPQFMWTFFPLFTCISALHSMYIHLCLPVYFMCQVLVNTWLHIFLLQNIFNSNCPYLFPADILLFCVSVALKRCFCRLKMNFIKQIQTRNYLGLFQPFSIFASVYVYYLNLSRSV